MPKRGLEDGTGEDLYPQATQMRLRKTQEGKNSLETCGNQSCCAPSPAPSGLAKCQGRSAQHVMVLAVPRCVGYWVSDSSAATIANRTGPESLEQGGELRYLTEM